MPHDYWAQHLRRSGKSAFPQAMTRTAIILAGGMGTRLQKVLPDIPKPMAPIHQKPFLEHLINYLLEYDINHFILSVGYKKHIIMQHFGGSYKNAKISYAVEEIPLGTGGAAKNALDLVNENQCLIVNGDTFFSMDFKNFFKKASDKPFSIAVRKEELKGRYGSVSMDNEGKITGFHEKTENHPTPWMNAGIYYTSKDVFLSVCPEAPAFSMEKDVLPLAAERGLLFGVPMEGAFIDIGIPEDYERASRIIPPLGN
ncbi:MAG: nucleotidyltransferase family protein [Bacteroidia bacterium]|nr:nucleotidyltransferase family protein [Bacteroidia bacterium]